MIAPLLLYGSIMAIEAKSSGSPNNPTIAAEGQSSGRSLPSMMSCLVGASSKEMVGAVSSAAAVVAMFEEPPWKPADAPAAPVDDVCCRCCRALLLNRQGWLTLAKLACWHCC